MGPKLHEIDPNGDTLFILRNPNAPFAVPAPFTGSERKPPKLESAGGEPEVRMRLSSKHLALASAYFQRLTANEWKETTAEGDYSYVVNAEDWDEEAVLILMNIIHGRTAKLPREMELELLAKITVLVDYYQCHEVVEFFTQTWLQSIDRVSPTGNDLLLRLSVSCVFPDPGTFKELTMTLIKESTGPIDSLGLPIPQTVIDAVNERRENSIPAIVDSLKGLIRDEYDEGVLVCSFSCSSMFIGALSIGMDSLRLSDQYLIPPYVGHSLATLKKGIFGFREPDWGDFCEKYRRRQSCSLSEYTRPVVEAQIKQVVGLELKDFINTL